MALILTSEAALGFANSDARCPYLATSCSSDAWYIGAWLLATGRSAPRDVRKSRGNTYHVNDMKVRADYRKGLTYIERIS